jgi:integrase
MPRRNSGPRLRFFERRGCYYIFWTEGGRSRERSTGTTDREEAEKALAVFIFARTRRAGPRGPAETLVTTVLGDYAEVHADTLGFDRIAYAVRALVPFWQERTVAGVNEATCRQYVKHRGVANGTARRELSVLRTAINCAVKSNRLTHAAAVWLPKAPEPLDVWLTRGEVARLLPAARMLLNAPHLPLAILLLGRKEAVLSLRWGQVNLEKGVIDYRRPGAAETLKRRGVVKAHRKLLGHLRRAKINVGEMDFVIQWGGHRV